MTAAMDGAPKALIGLEPLDVACSHDNGWSKYVVPLTWAFIALGVALRLGRYLQCFPLWGDECMVAVNFLNRGYLELMQPLDHYQICPLLFLWVELTAVKLFGFSEWSLRLFPLMCGIASLFLFRHVAGRLLRGIPLVLAVGIFCVSYYPFRHAVEVKPYSLDVLVALGLMALTVEWWRAPRQVRWLWGLVVLIPLAIFSSFPSMFIAGAVSLAILPRVWQRREARTWLAFAAYNAALLASFSAVYFLFAQAHHAAAQTGGIHRVTSAGFPPLEEPLKLLTWLLEVHTGRTFAHPLGGAHGASILTAACFAIGLVVLWRRRRLDLLLLCLTPFALGLIAAFMRRYPYGLGTRVMLYLTPSICLMTGLGAAAVISRISSQRHWQRCVGLSLSMLFLIGVGSLVHNLVKPYKTKHDRELRNFARWFWTEQAHGAELVCTTSDLHRCFYPELNFFAIPEYLCNQQIYSSRRRNGEAVQWDRISADHPLRCVVPEINGAPPNAEAVAAWVREMQQDYQLQGYDEFVVNAAANTIYGRRYSVYEFIPKPAPSVEVANQTAIRSNGDQLNR